MKHMHVVVFVIAIIGAISVFYGVSAKGLDQEKIEYNEKDLQVIYLGLDGDQYLPKEIVVESGKPVKLINDGSLAGCAFNPVQPEIGMNANFKKSDEYVFIPQKTGSFNFACSHGHMKGIITVV